MNAVKEWLPKNNKDCISENKVWLEIKIVWMKSNISKNQVIVLVH